MKYVPCLISSEAELLSLQNQNLTTNIMPLIQIVKDKKRDKSELSILTDLEEIIKKNNNVNFFITIPRNYSLKKLKKPIEKFFITVDKRPNYITEILNRFATYSNVIPVIEVNLSQYTTGDMKKLHDSISSKNGAFAYRVYSKKLDLIEDELKSLITEDDYVIYDLGNNNLYSNSIKKEKNKLNTLKKDINFTSIVVKQVYSKELTFFKFENKLIEEDDVAYDLIDFDFYEDFSSDFDYFGDWAGIRTLPIYSGGMPYPSYLTIELDTFNHHSFRGIEKDAQSFESTLLPKYIKSSHWKTLNNSHKNNCYGCDTINTFIARTAKVNSASKWKSITIAHFISSMDYKIAKSII